MPKPLFQNFRFRLWLVSGRTALAHVEVSVQQQQRRLLPPPLVSDGKWAGASRAKRARFHGADVDRDLMVMQPPSRRCTPLAAGFSEPSLLVALDPERRPEEPAAFANEQRHGVQAALEAAFRTYGLPERMLMDNGPPWGTDSEHRHTRLTAWLMRLGIGPVHGRPYHPQTQGKNERFNRTLKAELIADRSYAELAAVQADFDRWRAFYNHRRPHQAIGDVPPAYRFRASERAFPERLPAIEYRTGLAIRRVQVDGRISFASRAWFVSRAFGGQQVALQPADRDGLFKVLFCTYHVGEIDLAKRP